MPRRSTRSTTTRAGYVDVASEQQKQSSWAGLIDLVGQGEIGKDSNVLYTHLGGQPTLNAYCGIF